MIKLPLVGAKKNKYRRVTYRKKGKVVLGLALKPEAKLWEDTTVLFLKQLPAIPEDRAAELVLVVDVKTETMTLELLDAGPYELKRHHDLTGILETVGDALQKAGRVFNDSRIIKITARMV